MAVYQFQPYTPYPQKEAHQSIDHGLHDPISNHSPTLTGINTTPPPSLSTALKLTTHIHANIHGRPPKQRPELGSKAIVKPQDLALALTLYFRCQIHRPAPIRTHRTSETYCRPLPA